MPLANVSTADQENCIDELKEAEEAYKSYRYDTDWKSFYRGFIEGRKEREK